MTPDAARLPKLPKRRQRVLVALAISAMAVGILYGEGVFGPEERSDFGQVWYSARAMLQGRDPYLLVGPGREFELLYPYVYPATAFVAAIPFAALPEREASLLLVALSTFLLAYGSTSEGWHLMPLFASAAFVDSAREAQWTIILTAALFIPWLGALALCKPQTGLAALAGADSKASVKAGLVGGAALLVASLFFLPMWPMQWLSNARTAGFMRVPVLSLVGVPAVLVLLRWKRPEAWVVLASAILPQTFAWYSSLMLLALAASYREAALLSLVSTTGFLLATLVTQYEVNNMTAIAWVTYVATTLVPITLVILRRPNEGKGPAWFPWRWRHSTQTRIP